MADNNFDLSIYKPYKKNFDFSYTLGAFPTMELIKMYPDKVRCVFIHSKYEGSADFEKECRLRKINIIYNDKVINRISSKDNCFIIGVFDKFYNELHKEKNHIVLVNPSDMGNLGTIIRTVAGLGIDNLAIIMPCADVFNPKTIRASMGAIFQINIQIFDSFDSYYKLFNNHDMFPFMLDGDRTLKIDECPKSSCFSLIFGNEASGLPDEFKNIGQSIFIPQTEKVDSLNLPVSVSIGSFIFLSKN